jgi:ribosome-associated toxin RatA of RatAB toxin-antitoxin module
MVLKWQEKTVAAKQARFTLRWQYKYTSTLKGAKITRYFTSLKNAENYFVDNFGHSNDILCASIIPKVYISPYLYIDWQWSFEKKSFTR